ncbi:hypothetical protein [Pseudonocardia sp. GCM10023141]|uniref:hypothetical protein n=1 Tax=Pseudonocardia sp. GCM10023141 TaxID=3252653 RepID=UPI003613FD59
MPDTIDDVADELYLARPDEFVPTRDDAVARAKEQGDKDLARAIARLRRPTKAAWLANLLARKRADQLAALLSLAGDLADAQRTLDGSALRALSSQRSRLVAAMAREAGRLAYEAGDSAGESVLRELQGILEAGLADPAVADEIRSGRLTRTVSYSGFGPAAEPGTVPMPPRPVSLPDRIPAAAPAPAVEDDEAAARAERERERTERSRELTAAESEESSARHRQESDEAARQDAEAAHNDARERVSDLAAELETAREHERSVSATARAAAAAAKESARAAEAAAARAARARARYDELG